MKTIALVGQPNVGKSCFFNHLTGVNSIVGNYPGTTVELIEGITSLNGKKINVIDLPGTYALGNASEDERVVKKYLLEKKPDVVINIVDCTALARNLYLTLQLIEIGIPIVIALNLHEDAKKKGIEIFEKELGKRTKAPVIMVNATSGKGIYQAMKKAIGLRGKPKTEFIYDDHIEEAIRKVEGIISDDIPLPKRSLAIRLLEGDSDLLGYVKAEDKLDEFKNVKEHPDLVTAIAIARHGEAGILADKCSKIKKGDIGLSITEKLDRVITQPILGAVITAGILLLMLFILFIAGGFLEELIALPFEELILPWLRLNLGSMHPMLFKTIEFAVIGIEAGLAIAVPYIGLFYLMLALLEDSGYLSRLAYLSDNVMHALGLHGKASIPLLLGFGCNVPGIKGVKILSSARERFIAAILVVLVPCSAVTAVILGAAGHYIGFEYALLIYAISFALIFVAGVILNKMLPGQQMGLIIEFPDYRMPSIKNVLAKTWLRMKGFFYMAFPILTVGSAFLGLLVGANLLPLLMAPFRPVIEGWLMLPDVVGISLIYGVLRKEMALETLVALAGTINLLEFMSPLQIFTFSLVTTIYIPCLATITVLYKEFGIKKALLISIATIGLAILIGGIAARALLFAGLLV